MVEHRTGVTDGFTKKYGVHRLVWFEEYAYVTAAIEREKRLKKWNRAWKLQLIEEKNPNWDDLFDTLFLELDEPSAGFPLSRE
jgi:putative endonuclease